MRECKSRFLLGALVLLIAFSYCLSSHVASVHAADPTLADILSHLGFTNIAETALETFPAGTYNITFYAQFAEHIDENQLSYYQVNTSTYNVIFNASEGGFGYVSSPITKTFAADYQFGLSLVSWQQTRYHSEVAKNPDNQTHVKVYKNLDNPTMLLIGYDERSFCTSFGDQDFNDMVFSLQLQYYLRVISPYDTPTGEGWYCNGTNAFASLAESIVDHGNGTRRVFTQWNGDAYGADYSKSDPIYMNKNKTAIATWKTQQYLTIKTDPLGMLTIPGQGWYDQGQATQLTALPAPGYGFSYWDIDGISQGNGVNPITVNMNVPHTTTAHYLQWYTLTIDISTGGTTNPPPGNYSQNPNSTIQIAAVPATNYILDFWMLDASNVGSTNPYAVLMDKNHTLKAVFKYSPPLAVSIDPPSKTINLGESVDFTSTVNGGTGPYNYQWYVDNNPVPGAKSTAWSFVPTAAGVHYVKLKVSDSKGSSIESAPARIQVSPRLVGGYSVPLQKQTPAGYIAAYMFLISLFGTVLVTVKRKRK